jgi:hypothetical protein
VIVTTRWAALLAGFLFFLDLNNFTAIVETAAGANGVRQAHRTAVGAGNDVSSHQSILGASAITAALGVLALGMWGHGTFSFYMHQTGVCPSE